MPIHQYNFASKYKNASGQPLVKALFYETNITNPEQILYTLKDEDFQGYPSLRRLYIEERDETEYRFANKYFYNFDHWKTVSENTYLLPSITNWREELATIFLQEYLAKIKIIANGEGRDAFAAQRYLIDKPYLKGKQPFRRVGRPDKEIPQPDQKMIGKGLEDDLARITGSVN